MKKKSLKDIAKIIGVSPSTISFVLNGKAKEMRISEDLTAKILSITQEIGYQPNQVAISLRTGKSKMLGVIVETITGAFFSILAKVIEDEVALYGYKVVHSSTDNDSRKGGDIINMLFQRQVDGYIITPALGMEKEIAELIASKKPVVFIDSNLPDFNIPSVSVDNYAGTQEGLKHLIEKGYKKIGFVNVDIELDQMKQRTKAYFDTLKAYGLVSNDELFLQLPYNYQKEEGVEQISNWIKSTPNLDAIFFATNYLGITGLESLLRLGLKIPDDIAMICFDDHDLFRLYPPGITCIQQPIAEIAKAATQMLMNQLENITPCKETNIQLPVKLIIRGSS